MREGNYLKHKCAEMKRHEIFKGVTGQAAWAFYKLWLGKKNRNPMNADSFLSSSFFNAFVKFAEFVKKVNLPNPDRFVWLMVQKKYRPNVWTDDIVYRMYLEFVDRQVEPLDRAESTIKALQRICGESNCKISEVFNHMTAAELVHRLYIRELSPWIILNSPKFWKFYKNANTADKVMLENVIRVQFWKEQFKKHPSDHKNLKSMVKRLNL